MDSLFTLYSVKVLVSHYMASLSSSKHFFHANRHGHKNNTRDLYLVIAIINYYRVRVPH